MQRVRQGHGPRSDAGLSLVELLVALALGAFITLGIVQMFTANRETYELGTGQARLQESARFALDFLARSVRMAGYMGCGSDQADVLNVLAPAGSPPFEHDFETARLVGWDGGSDGSWTGPVSVTALPGVDSTTFASGTDVLFVRRVESGGVPLRADMANASDEIPVTVPAEQSGSFEAGSILVVGDCTRATVFQMTNSPGSGDVQIQHATGAGAPGNHQAALAESGGGFDVVSARVYPVRSEVYYVARREDGAPLSLWRRRTGEPTAELVEGISDLQIRYGIDVNADGVPDTYAADLAGLGANDEVVTLRLTVTATSAGVAETGGTPRLQRAFTQTVALRNTG